MKQQSPIVLFMIIVFSIHNLSAQLSPGDIVITTINEDSDESFSFLTFENLPIGTTVYFTDEGWDAVTNNFGKADEGTVTWTATTNVSPLSEVVINNVSSGQISASTGTVSIEGNFHIQSSKDQLIIYQLTSTNTPSFIYLFSKGDSILNNSPTGIHSSSFQTMIPSSLTLGVNVFQGPNINNWQFDCNNTKSGNKESLLNLFMDSSNYNKNSSLPYRNGALQQNGCNFEFSNQNTSRPIINKQTIYVREDAPINTAISVPNVDNNGNTQFKNWTIVGGKDESLFKINPNTGLITVKNNSNFDFEQIPTPKFEIHITTEDNDGNKSLVSQPTGLGVINIIVKDYSSTITVTSDENGIEEGKVGVFTFSNSTPSLSPIVIDLKYYGFAEEGINYAINQHFITIPPNTSSVKLNVNTLVDNFDNTNVTLELFPTLENSNNDLTIDDLLAEFTIIEKTEEDGSGYLGISDNEFSKNLTLYPNPGTGIFYLTSRANDNLEYLELFNLRGKLIKKTALNHVPENRHRLDFSSIANGAYLVKIHSTKTTGVKKLFIISE